MAVSIDARVGQREIDAAREGGADIEGVTSIQGTPVADAEQQITFGGYPNQIGPTRINGDKSKFDKELGKWEDLVAKTKATADEYDKSIEEFEALLARIRGDDTQATEEEAASINAMLSKQRTDAWANLMSQGQGFLHPDFMATATPEQIDYELAARAGKVDYNVIETLSPAAGAIEIKNREIQARNEELDRLIAEQTLANKRANVSPWMGEVRMGPPGEWYGGTPVQEDLGSGYRPSPFTSPISPEGALTGVNPFAKGKPIDSDYPNLTFEQWQDFYENKALVTSFDPKFEESISHLVDVPKDKATVKSKYGAWKGKYNNLTAKQNLENLATFRKGWMSDFEKRFGSAKHFGLTRPTVNGKQISWDDNRLRNQVMRTDEFLNAYDSVYGTSKGAKMLGNILSKGVGTVGNMAQSFVNKKGAGNADKFDTTVKKVTSGEYGGGAEVQPQHPREKVGGGFWGLMAFAKENKKLFESLSGDELWALVSDPDEFWAFYEDALNAQ
jgi:hypothetical protein